MGRIAQSKEEKELKGTGNKTREDRRGEPEYPKSVQVTFQDDDEPEKPKPITIPVAPDDLSEKAARVWNLNGFQIAEMGLYANSAYAYLHNYCRLIDIIDESYMYYRGEKYMYAENGTKYMNPAFKEYTTALGLMATIGAKFGFTPADKTKLNMRLITEAPISETNAKKNISPTGKR